MPAFFIASSDIRDDHLTVTGDLAHHLRASLRVKPGEILCFTDDQPCRYRGEVTHVSPQAVTVRVIDRLPGPPEQHPRLLLAQAILKGDHMDWVVQKASELGVHTIRPLIARHGVVRPQAGRIAGQLARWQRIALEAAQQSEQWRPPTIVEPMDASRWFSSATAASTFLLAERQEAVGLATIPLTDLDPGEPLALAIGPEGGWSADERSAAALRGCRSVSLGEPILRADTAALAALAIVQSRLGRLG